MKRWLQKIIRFKPVNQLYNILLNIFLQYKHRHLHLKIGWSATIYKSRFGHYNTVYPYAKLNNVVLSDFVYIGERSEVLNARIGKFCSIAPDVKIGLGDHPTTFISTFPAFFSTGRQCQVSFAEVDSFREMGTIEIGNDVWIGANVLVLNNVVIGDGAVVAAGAVVTKDIEPYAIVAGVPARVIKKRFTEERISELLGYKWWDRDIQWIKENSNLFNYPEVFFRSIKTNT